MRRRLREQASIGDFTASQSAALQRLESEGPMTVSALARAEGLRPQSMGAIIAVLEAQRLVAGTPDPRDGRQTLFALTSLCMARLAQGRAAHQDWLAEHLMRLNKEERAQMAAAVALLERISAN